MTPPLVAAITLGALALVDVGARRMGLYQATAQTWPAMLRRLPPRGPDASPYRADSAREWEVVTPPGMPVTTSIFVVPVALLLLLWGTASILAIGDFKDVFRGARSLPVVLAVLALCIVRTVAGCVSLVGAFDRSSRVFFAGAGLALGIDLALLFLAIPCSDIRADDVGMATVGAAAQAALALGFAASLMRRRGLTASDTVAI